MCAGEMWREIFNPQPIAAYPNKERHIPFCPLIKNWLVNQTSGSYTSLSFEGKALFPSCGPFSSSNTTNYTTFVCYELALPLPGQELDSDHHHKCLIMGHNPNKASSSWNISRKEEKMTVKCSFPCISSGVSHSCSQIRGFLGVGWESSLRQIVFIVQYSENKSCKACVYLKRFFCILTHICTKYISELCIRGCSVFSPSSPAACTAVISNTWEKVSAQSAAATCRK